MNIGHARVCLTPKEPVYLIGYRSENRYQPATGVHDDIYANALLFEQDQQQVFVFSADFLEFEEEMAEEVKTLLYDRFGIQRDRVLLCATHNHSSIVAYHKGWYTNKFNQQYYDWLLETIAQCYQNCNANKKEATARYGKQIVLGYYGNRNHPGKPADNEVIVVKFYDSQGTAFAGIVNWAVHSTLISADHTQLTAELAGNVSKKLHVAFGFYPAMIVGAAGDCSNRHERQGNGFHELERVSSALADIIGSIQTDQSIQLSQIRSQTLFHTIHHHMQQVHADITNEIISLQAEQLQSPTKQASATNRISELEKKLLIHDFHLDAKGVVIQLGELQLFIFPGELGSAFGKQLKADCPVLAIICGYTNGYYEYFMPKEEYGLSFETIGSPIPKGEAECLIEKYSEVSKQLMAITLQHQ